MASDRINKLLSKQARERNSNGIIIFFNFLYIDILWDSNIGFIWHTVRKTVSKEVVRNVKNLVMVIKSTGLEDSEIN